MSQVTIIDVSPRDGLQIDSKIISTEEKITLINKIVEAGISKVEVTSFVHPKKVPQMADASAVLNGVKGIPQLEAITLIPNLRGYERLKDHQVSEINWVTAATDSFNQKNIGISIDENFLQFKKIIDHAHSDEVKVNFSIAVSFGCPYEGDVQEDQVLSLIKRAKEAGADRITIADTIGIATPKQVEELIPKVIKNSDGIPIAVHFHDTRGLGSANAYAAYKSGIRIFETAVSGIGGCPFAPGAAGNLATEDLVYLFERMDISTNINFNLLLEAADYAASLSSRKPLGKIRTVQR